MLHTAWFEQDLDKQNMAIVHKMKLLYLHDMLKWDLVNTVACWKSIKYID